MQGIIESPSIEEYRNLLHYCFQGELEREIEVFVKCYNKLQPEHAEIRGEKYN